MSIPMVSVDVDGVSKWQRRMGDMSAELRDFRPLADRLDPIVYAHLTKWIFQDGPSIWQPLSPKYAAWKKKHYPGRPIMILTGDLIGSLSGPGAQFSIRRITRDGGEWGTNAKSHAPGSANAPYPTFHQRGKGVPKRKLIVVNNEFRLAFLHVAGEYVRYANRSRG